MNFSFSLFFSFLFLHVWVFGWLFCLPICKSPAICAPDEEELGKTQKKKALWQHGLGES